VVEQTSKQGPLTGSAAGPDASHDETGGRPLGPPPAGPL